MTNQEETNPADNMPVDINHKVKEEVPAKRVPMKKKSAAKKKKPAPGTKPKTVEDPREKPVVLDTPLPSKVPTPVKRSTEIPDRTDIPNNPETPNKDKEKPISDADEIWQTIQSRQIELFGLPGQIVSAYCAPMPIDPRKCFLKYKVAAVVPALELAAPEFNVERTTGYIVLSKKQVYL